MPQAEPEVKDEAATAQAKTPQEVAQEVPVSEGDISSEATSLSYDGLNVPMAYEGAEGLQTPRLAQARPPSPSSPESEAKRLKETPPAGTVRERAPVDDSTTLQELVEPSLRVRRLEASARSSSASGPVGLIQGLCAATLALERVDDHDWGVAGGNLRVVQVVGQSRRAVRPSPGRN